MNAEIVLAAPAPAGGVHAPPGTGSLYGGAAGGGKSDALVIEALRRCTSPTIGAHPAQDLPPAQ